MESVEVFFDGLIFLLIALTGYATATVVWLESRMERPKLTREQRAIILRSSGIAALFTWAFVRAFVPALDNWDAVTWSLRSFLLVGMINYLYILISRFIRRHGWRYWENKYGADVSEGSDAREPLSPDLEARELRAE